MTAWSILGVSLMLTGVTHAGVATQPAPGDWPVDFKMLSAGRGVVLVGGSASVFDIEKGTREVAGAARRMAVNRKKQLVLLEQRGEEGETLTVLDVKGHPQALASAEIHVLVADIGYANYPGFDTFFVAWTAPGPSTEAGQPIWGTYVLLYDPQAKVVVLGAVPLLSDLRWSPAPPRVDLCRSLFCDVHCQHTKATAFGRIWGDVQVRRCDGWRRLASCQRVQGCRRRSQAGAHECLSDRILGGRQARHGTRPTGRQGIRLCDHRCEFRQDHRLRVHSRFWRDPGCQRRSAASCNATGNAHLPSSGQTGASGGVEDLRRSEGDGGLAGRHLLYDGWQDPLGGGPKRRGNSDAASMTYLESCCPSGRPAGTL